MAIDDEVSIRLQQVREDVDDAIYLPNRLTRLGISGVTASLFAQLPFVSQIMTNLLSASSGRFEDRFLKLAEALERQQRLLSDQIPDRRYYESDGFQTLLLLILERLHTTHQDEKLKTFGETLANSGTQPFIKDDKEEYIRTLRDMSLEDITALRRIDAFHKLPSAQRGGRKGILKSENASLARLAGLGLIHETLEMREFSLSIPTVPVSRQSPEGYARGLADAFKRYMEKAPTSTYRLSVFGRKFLAFIESASPGADAVA